MPSPKRPLKYLLAILTVAITLCCLIATVRIISTVSIQGGIDDLPFNDVTSKSIDTQLDLAKTLFQISLLMTGALWGLVIAKKDDVKIVSANTELVVMFLSSSVVMLVSMLCYGVYLRTLSHYFADAAAAAAKGGLDASIPDIFDQNINYLFLCQIISLGAGILNGVITLVAAHTLKGETS